MADRAQRIAALPLSLPPRGLSRVEAATYIGVSPTLFDRMVGDGRMPRPKRVGERRVWDRTALDAAFADLPDEHDDQEQLAGSQWHATL
jgi:predicted DNA-binding transcriptional regulator AlpA